MCGGARSRADAGHIQRCKFPSEGHANLIRTEMEGIRRWHMHDRNMPYALDDLSKTYDISVASGDLLYLDGKSYLTHSGLLGIARRKRCFGIQFCPATNIRNVERMQRTAGGQAPLPVRCRRNHGFGLRPDHMAAKNRCRIYRGIQ